MARARILCWLLLAVAAGCDRVPSLIVVTGADSMIGAFSESAKQYEGTHQGSSVRHRFLPKERMATRIPEDVEVIVYPDEKSARELLDGAPMQVFARNQMVIVTKQGRASRPRSFADLARPGLDLLICRAEVPEGRYAREVLRKAGIAVPEREGAIGVKAIVNAVIDGKADAGIVYVTDLAQTGVGLQAVPIPDEYNVVVDCCIGVRSSGGSTADAEAFVAFVKSPAGQAILRKHGFLPAP